MPLLSEAVKTYLTHVQITKRPRTYEAAHYDLKEFLEVMPDRPIEELTRTDLLSYLAAMQKKRHSARTMSNRYVRVRALLRFHNISLPNDRPKFTPRLPEVYTDAELAALFSACDFRQRVFYRTLLCTGLRKEETRWLHWSDIEGKMLHVQPHPPGFNPKNHEARRIPIPPDLLSLLHQLPRYPGALIFATRNGLPDRHLLRNLKRLCVRAGLDESKYWLHKFRATYATNLLRKGIDLKTVQALLGHRDVASTMRYLRPLEGDALYDKIAAAFTV